MVYLVSNPADTKMLVLISNSIRNKINDYKTMRHEKNIVNTYLIHSNSIISKNMQQSN